MYLLDFIFQLIVFLIIKLIHCFNFYSNQLYNSQSLYLYPLISPKASIINPVNNKLLILNHLINLKSIIVILIILSLINTLVKVLKFIHFHFEAFDFNLLDSFS